MAKPWRLPPRSRRVRSLPPMATGPSGESRAHPKSKRDRDGRLHVAALWIGAPPAALGAGPAYIECPHCWVAGETEGLNTIATSSEWRTRITYADGLVAGIECVAVVLEQQADGMCSHCGALLVLRIRGWLPLDHAIVRELREFPGIPGIPGVRQ